MRRAVGRARPVAVATSLSVITGRTGWKARITSSPRASASMKSGPVSGRAGMADLSRTGSDSGPDDGSRQRNAADHLPADLDVGGGFVEEKPAVAGLLGQCACRKPH